MTAEQKEIAALETIIEQERMHIQMMDNIKVKRDNEIEAKVTAVEHTRRVRQRQLIAKNAEFEQRKKD